MYKCKYNEANKKKTIQKEDRPKKLIYFQRSDKEIYHFRARPFK